MPKLKFALLPLFFLLGFTFVIENITPPDSLAKGPTLSLTIFFLLLLGFLTSTFNLILKKFKLSLVLAGIVILELILNGLNQYLPLLGVGGGILIFLIFWQVKLKKSKKTHNSIPKLKRL